MGLSVNANTAPGGGRRQGRFLLTLALAAAGLLAAACGSSSTGTSAGHSGSPVGASNKAASANVVTTHSTSLGPVVAGPDGRTVYLFEKDKGTASSCSGACATTWPPVTTSAAPSATGLAKAKLLGTTHRSDGKVQVTYAGHPLYYFAGDRAATDVTGEGLKNFGAGWYVLKPTGQKIDED